MPGSVLSQDGTVVKDAEIELDDAEVLECYEAMTLSRAFDERCFALQRQGRLGTFSTVHGEEAAVVGSAWALRRGTDWVVPQYRELPAMLRLGYSLEQFLRYFMGDPSGNAMPADVNVLPFQISLAAQLPHAVGLAWGLQRQGSDAVVMTYFGDGASSEGDAHEAMNLAGVRKAPVVFVLKNNGWAISTPVAVQTAATSFAARAAGYGMAGVAVDGNDLFAVYSVCREAVARARAGDGPTLIEARTWRLGPHNTSDDPGRYVDADELERRRGDDPILRVERYLRSRGSLDDDVAERIGADNAARIDAATAEAEAAPKPHAGQIFEHVYAQLPQRLTKQRDELAREDR